MTEDQHINEVNLQKDWLVVLNCCVFIVGFDTWAQHSESIGFDAEGRKGITAAVAASRLIIIHNVECEWCAETGYN